MAEDLDETNGSSGETLTEHVYLAKPANPLPEDSETTDIDEEVPIERLSSSNLSVYSYDMAYSRYKERSPTLTGTSRRATEVDSVNNGEKPHSVITNQLNTSEGLPSPSSTAIAIANGSDYDHPLNDTASVTVTSVTDASVTENPQAWAAYDYPVPVSMLGRMDDYDIASPMIDYTAPRQPIFPMDTIKGIVFFFVLMFCFKHFAFREITNL